MYVGDFVRGQKEGEGTIVFQNKSFYAGQWKNDRRHGKGSLTSYRESYIGLWKKDLVCIFLDKFEMYFLHISHFFI
jgi:hypothetical protein